MAHLPIIFSLRTSVVTVGAASTQVVAANDRRKYLAICNIGTVSASFKTDAAAVAASGWPLVAASSPGEQGGAIIFEATGVPQGAVNAIVNTGTVATNIAVLEGY